MIGLTTVVIAVLMMAEDTQPSLDMFV